MRDEGINRLSSTEVSLNRRDYIVLYFLFQDLKKVIRESAKGQVLDIGCGNKPYESWFEGRVTEYKGCDVVQSNLCKVDVVCEATALDFPNDRFDTVFSTQVIEHVSDPFTMLREAFRVMRPDGVLILSAPFCWELHEEPYDFFRYSKYGLRSMIENAGFQIEVIIPNGGKWAAIGQLWINIIYSTFTSKKWYTKLLKGLFLNLRFTSFLNWFFVKLDKANYSDLLTLNYVVVARKVKSFQ